MQCRRNQVAFAFAFYRNFGFIENQIEGSVALIECQRRTEREANGLNLPPDIWQNIVGAAESVGITDTPV